MANDIEKQLREKLGLTKSEEAPDKSDSAEEEATPKSKKAGKTE